MSKAKKAGSAHWGSLRHPSIFWVGHKDDDDAVTEMKATGGKWNFFFGWALQYISHPSSPQYLLYFAWFYREIERRSLANCIGKKNGLCSHRQLNIGHSYGFGSQAKPRTHTHVCNSIARSGLLLVLLQKATDLLWFITARCVLVLAQGPLLLSNNNS